MISPIGGYFEWEVQGIRGAFPNSDGILVNSGRHALEYILSSIVSINTIYVPYFTCEVVLQPIERLGLNYKFYRINNRLEIANSITLGSDDYLIYTNYFGVKDAYVDKLVSIYGHHLIVDNAQAFFARPNERCYQFYSPRKFVGCPDGGIAVAKYMSDKVPLPQGKSYNKCNALLQRLDGEISLGYDSFHMADGLITNEPMSKMSLITQNILSNIDYSRIIEARRTNFNYLNSALASSNKLSGLTSTSALDSVACPMVYPYLTDDVDLRQKLIDNKVFVAKYWPNVLQWCSPSELEYQLTQQIIPLPIDQRYGEEEMKYILSLI